MRKDLKSKCIGLHLMNPNATSVDIALMLGPGVLPQYVSATLRRNGLVPVKGRRNLVVPHILRPVADKLEPEADKRGMTTSELILALITIIANECMVGAILDDADELEIAA